MTDPLSIGMLGYRFMGRAHANALARLPMFFPEAPDTRRSVLIGRDESALAEAAARLGFSRTRTDWRDAIDEIDVLYNLGPNHIHADPSIAALEDGVHVFCEKPLARDLEEAKRMRIAARSSSATSAIGFNYRFLPAIQYARELIDDGALGEIYHVRGRYLQDWLVDPNEPWSWRNDEDLSGTGALGDLGSHTVDLVRFLVGRSTGPITAVSGDLQTFVEERPDPDGTGARSVTVDDAFTAQVRFTNGALGTFEATRFATGSKNDLTIEISGSLGSLRFNLERPNELELLEEGNRGFETILVTDESDPYIERWWPPGHMIGWEHTFVHEDFAFLDAVASEESHAPAFEEGYRVQEVLDAIEGADRNEGWVELDEPGPNG